MFRWSLHKYLVKLKVPFSEGIDVDLATLALICLMLNFKRESGGQSSIV